MSNPKSPESDVAALVGELRADVEIFNRGPNYGPIVAPPSALNLRAADALESLTSKVKEAGEPGAVAGEALRAYEAWEADVILNADWSGDLPTLTQHQWDWLVDIQSKRNAALLPAAALKGEAVAGDDFVALRDLILGLNEGTRAEVEKLFAAETKARETVERELAQRVIGNTVLDGLVAEKCATITTLRAELVKAGEALEPFAEAAASYDPEEGDGWVHDFPITSLRRARAALTSISDGAPKQEEG
jgi:hypothetical protein